MASILDLLRDGYAAASLAEGVGVEASKRMLGGAGYNPELVHGLLFARAARFVLEFSRSGERLYALFEAALRVRSPGTYVAPVAGARIANEADGLHRIAEDLDSRRPMEAAEDVRAYLSGGHRAPALISLLARHATLDSAVANQGHNLLLADACVSEYAGSRAPESLMALAKTLAAAPRDAAASKAWASALGL